jgi:uncharacterized protein YybS (DUF2232 family)
VLQRSPGRNGFAADLSQRLNAFSPLPFDAAMDAQGIYGAHWVNLADKLTCFVNDLMHYLMVSFAFARELIVIEL